MSALTLVTGATGFIGGYVVRQLVSAGVRTRVLVRRPALLPPGVRPHVEVVQADVRDAAALVAAVEGVDTVLHLAACARAWSRDPTEFGAINIVAVDRLLEAAFRAGVERLVHVSTILTLPPRRCGASRGGRRRTKRPSGRGTGWWSRMRRRGGTPSSFTRRVCTAPASATTPTR